MSSNAPRPTSRLERQLRTLEGLLALDSFELRPTLDQAARLLAEVLGADKIDIFLYQAENQSLVALGVSPTPMGRREIAIGMDRQPIANDGRAAEVFQTGRPYLSGHVDQDSEELVGIREGLGVRSEMIVPLDVAGERRGVLMANSAEPERFPEADLSFLESVARWIGMVTHRAEQAEQIARLAEERGRRAAIEELVNRLTPREQEVAALVSFGLSSAQSPSASSSPKGRPPTTSGASCTSSASPAGRASPPSWRNSASSRRLWMGRGGSSSQASTGSLREPWDHLGYGTTRSCGRSSTYFRTSARRSSMSNGLPSAATAPIWVARSFAQPAAGRLRGAERPLRPTEAPVGYRAGQSE